MSDDPHIVCSHGVRNCADCMQTCTGDEPCPCCAWATLKAGVGGVTERRPHWTDDLIEAVADVLEHDDYIYATTYAVIAAVEDWARWEHVPKGTLARLEQAEAAIARVRELHTPHRCQMSTRHTNCSINFDGGCSRKSKCQVCRVDYPCATVRALDGGAE